MNLKAKIRDSGVYQWEIAELVGVGEATMCRWLRRPEKLRPATVQKIEAAIRALEVEKRAENE